MADLTTGFLEATPTKVSEGKSDDHIWVGFAVKNTEAYPEAVSQYKAIEARIGVGRGGRSAFVKKAVHDLIMKLLGELAAEEAKEDGATGDNVIIENEDSQSENKDSQNDTPDNAEQPAGKPKKGK